MSIIMVLKIIAALLTAATGVLGFVRPDLTYGFTGLRVEGARGVSEIRAILGGLFIGLGVAPLFLGATAYTMLGIGYLAIFVARAISMVVDRSYARSNIISLVVEIVLGLILIVP